MIKIGIVGAGGMGTVHHSNYAYIDDCEVMAIVGRSNKDKERAEQWGLPLYEDISSMLDQEEIDLVDICTPTFLHKPHVLESLRRGKHTLTEKPIALSRNDAEEMLALAREKGVFLFVGQVLQFTKEVQLLRELVTSKKYGTVLDAYFERLSACPRWAQGGWLFDKEKSGHLPFDLHIHDLDVIVSLFGKPDSYQVTSCSREGIEYQEQYRFLYQFGKLHVAAEAAWFNADIPFTARWRVYFEDAVVINDGNQVIAYQFDKEPHVFDTEDKIKISTGINVPPTGIYLSELSHFVDCIKKGQRSDRITEEQLLTVIEILEKITKEKVM